MTRTRTSTRTRRPNRAAAALLAAAASAAAFWALTSTLDDMTARDCRAGVERACQSLNRHAPGA
jgi:hypothetical protein